MARITATEASRRSSSVLSRAAGGDRVHAGPWADLARRRASVGSRDLWIAATAIAHGMGLVSADVGDFRRVPGLRPVAS